MIMLSIYKTEIEIQKDFLFSMLPPRVGQSVSLSFKHWLKFKGPQFLVKYLGEIRHEVLEDNLGVTHVRGVKKILSRYLSGTLTSYPCSLEHRQSLLLRFCKTASLYKSSVTEQDYLDKKRVLAQPMVFNDQLAEELLRNSWNPQKPFPTKYKYSSGRSWLCEFVGRFGELSPQNRYRAAASLAFLFPRFASLFSGFFSGDQPLEELMRYDGFFPKVMGGARLLTKDGGLKKRLIFIPHPLLQLALEPLYHSLKKFSYQLKSLAIYDQTEATEWISEQPRLWSIDLESATDFFPVEWQRTVLLQLFPHLELEIDLFYEVARGKWLSPFQNEISLAVGQPMGLRCSFLAFSVTFFTVVKGIIPPDQFRMLGDDLITNSPEVLPGLLSLGLKISFKKSLFNSPNGEWGGSSFMKGVRVGDKRIKSPTTLLSSIETRTWEVAVKSFRRLYPRSFIRRLKLLASLPPPVGVGHNPKVVAQLTPEEVKLLYFPGKRFWISQPESSCSIGAHLDALSSYQHMVGSIPVTDDGYNVGTDPTGNAILLDDRGFLQPDLLQYKDTVGYDLLKSYLTYDDAVRCRSFLSFVFKRDLRYEPDTFTPAFQQEEDVHLPIGSSGTAFSLITRICKGKRVGQSFTSKKQEGKIMTNRTASYKGTFTNTQTEKQWVLQSQQWVLVPGEVKELAEKKLRGTECSITIQYEEITGTILSAVVTE